MTKMRPSQLARFLQTVHQPIYLLDAESKLLFCNRALEDWVGCQAELLIGQRCRYRSAPSRLKHELVAAALAPPPEVFQHQSCQTHLLIDRITSTSRRLARFIPLEPEGTLVLVDSSDSHPTSPPEGAPLESTQRQAAQKLHQSLQSYLRRQAGRYRWDRMIGSSQTMQRIRRLGRLASDTNASVLIVGEEGTGREHLATAIHFGASSDTAGALVPIECAVLDAELIASTVMAFRKKFQSDKAAKRHSLLLKDADQLPDGLMPLILDFVVAASANQRLLSTTTVPVSQWKGRENLAVLLSTLLIEIPPLRERKEDIALLAQLFLEEENEQAAKQRAGFTAEALDLLCQYPWPGNLAELEYMILQSHPQGNATLVASADLPDRLRQQREAVAETQIQMDEQAIELDSFMQKIELELIVRAMDKAAGNKSKAAELLGITRPRLYRKLESFGMIEPGSATNDED